MSSLEKGKEREVEAAPALVAQVAFPGFRAPRENSISEPQASPPLCVYLLGPTGATMGSAFLTPVLAHAMFSMN